VGGVKSIRRESGPGGRSVRARRTVCAPRSTRMLARIGTRTSRCAADSTTTSESLSTIKSLGSRRSRASVPMARVAGS
jgi:hypothetical protein